MITVREAARRAAKSPETIRRWIRSGRLRARRIGTQHVIKEADLDELLRTDDVVGIPADWMETWTGEPMPNWVSALRRSRTCSENAATSPRRTSFEPYHACDVRDTDDHT